jgi:hypothetical protein
MATDVYALGVLLYQLLVGRHPTAEPGAPDAAMLVASGSREPSRPSDVVARGEQLIPRASVARVGLREQRCQRVAGVGHGINDHATRTAAKQRLGRPSPALVDAIDRNRGGRAFEPSSVIFREGLQVKMDPV